MSTPVRSHRVEVAEEERDSAFQDKRDSRGGPSQPYPHQFYPPGYWCPPYMYMNPSTHWPPYPHSSALTVPEGSSQPLHGHQSGMSPHYGPAQAQPPQYVAVNVHTDNHQHQSQKAQSAAKQITVKEKIIKNVSRGLEQLLDSRVLVAGLATILLPKVAHHLQQSKKKRRGLFLEFGLA